MFEKIFKFIDTLKSVIPFVTFAIDLVLDVIDVISSKLQNFKGGDN